MNRLKWVLCLYYVNFLMKWIIKVICSSSVPTFTVTHHCSFLICSSIMQFWAGCPFTIIRSGSIYSYSLQFCHKGFPDHWLLAAQKWCFLLASFLEDIFLWSVTRLDECRYLYFVSNHVFLLPKSHYCRNASMQMKRFGVQRLNSAGFGHRILC